MSLAAYVPLAAALLNGLLASPIHATDVVDALENGSLPRGAFDPARRELVGFGGNGQFAAVDETWVLPL